MRTTDSAGIDGVIRGSVRFSVLNSIRDQLVTFGLLPWFTLQSGFTSGDLM